MIYAIDNGEHSVEDHEVEFVEADASFGSWWKRKFAPWLEKVGRSHYIAFAASQVTWGSRGGEVCKPIDVATYLSQHTIGLDRITRERVAAPKFRPLGRKT